MFDFLSVERPLLRIEDIAATGRYTRSTAYRYLKQLCDAGFLAPAHGGTYSLGPRIVELERLLKLTDPLYKIGAEVLGGMRRDDCVFLVCNLYRDKVLCVHHEGPEVLHLDARPIAVQRSRGVPYPLFQGSGSLALLAHLSPHRIQQIYLKSAPEIARFGLGRTWDEFRLKLRGVRRNGYSTSVGQITPGLVGIAVPIHLPGEKRVVGSLTKIFAAHSVSEPVERACAAEIHLPAETIGRRMAEG